MKQHRLSPCIWHGKVEKAIKEMRNVEATRLYDVPGDVLGMLGDYKLKGTT
jgi:hypothetical protein